jgi:hypothetical protein
MLQLLLCPPDSLFPFLLPPHPNSVPGPVSISISHTHNVSLSLLPLFPFFLVTALPAQTHRTVVSGSSPSTSPTDEVTDPHTSLVILALSPSSLHAYVRHSDSQLQTAQRPVYSPLANVEPSLHRHFLSIFLT